MLNGVPPSPQILYTRCNNSDQEVSSKICFIGLPSPQEPSLGVVMLQQDRSYLHQPRMECDVLTAMCHRLYTKILIGLIFTTASPCGMQALWSGSPLSSFLSSGISILVQGNWNNIPFQHSGVQWMRLIRFFPWLGQFADFVGRHIS